MIFFYNVEGSLSYGINWARVRGRMQKKRGRDYAIIMLIKYIFNVCNLNNEPNSIREERKKNRIQVNLKIYMWNVCTLYCVCVLFYCIWETRNVENSI